jgi:hypothetical protein
VTPPPHPRFGLALRLAYGVVGAVVAAYIGARAILVPLTYDEAVIYLRYMSADWVALFEVGSGTNHFLNSVLTKVAGTIFGTDPWALRLPNMLAGMGYVLAAGAMARRAAHPMVGLAGFVLLVANPYLLDYFAVSRGYGLAIALLAWSTYWFLRWLDGPPVSPPGRRALARTVWLAAGAVAASFTVLPAMFAIAAVALARLVWTTPRQAIPPSGAQRLWRSYWPHAVVWMLVTAAFSLLVFSRDRTLSPRLFVPITVRVTGLLADELAEIRVFREDATGRFRSLAREPGGVWRTGDAREAWGLRVEMPASIDRNLASLDVEIGPEVFRRTRREAGPWDTRDTGAGRVLLGDDTLVARSAAGGKFGAINWIGDAEHWRLSLGYAGVVLAGLAMLGAAAVLAFHAAGRTGLVAAADARVLLAALMSVASLCAAPAYLLRRNNQLYFGGTSGLVTDTFGSIVAGLVYTVQGWPGQGQWALSGLTAGGAALLAACLLGARVRRALVAPSAVASVIAIVAAQTSLQHAVLGTPYLMARTSLFLLPLLVVYAVVLADALAAWGPRSRVVVTSAVVLLAAGSAWHAVAVANVSRSRDVPADAATPQMLRTVAAEVAASRRNPPVIRVGVEWMYAPVARYYAARQSNPVTRYDVHVVPAEEPEADFVYCSEGSPLGRGEAVRAFPQTQAVLWRPRGPADSP